MSIEKEGFIMPTIQDFEKGIQKYFRSCAFLADSSVTQRRLVCDKLIEYMSDRKNEQITVETLIDFRNSMDEFKPSTINKYMRILKSIFAWMLDMGIWYGGNPVRKNMEVPQHQHEIKNVLNDNDMMRIVRRREDAEKSIVYLRRRAITLLLVTSAMRESELIELRPIDLNWDKGTIYIANGKGGKDRTVLFYSVAQEAVKEYMKFRPESATDQDAVFLANDWRGAHKLDRRSIITDVKEYIRSTTGRTDISPHSLRHTAARYMLSNGVPMAEIQALLGHSTSAITEHYAKLLAPDVTPINSASTAFDKVYPHGTSI